jgi:hypothetical protein
MPCGWLIYYGTTWFGQSFVPPRPIRELRDLTRRRKQLLGDATSEWNRMQKTLEDANVKLGSMLSDVFGVSGQRMLDALFEGQLNRAGDCRNGTAEGAPKNSADHRIAEWPSLQ